MAFVRLGDHKSLKSRRPARKLVSGKQRGLEVGPTEKTGQNYQKIGKHWENPIFMDLFVFRPETIF